MDEKPVQEKPDYEELSQKVFLIDSKDDSKKKDRLVQEIRRLLDDIPKGCKASDENTQIALRIYTKRC